MCKAIDMQIIFSSHVNETHYHNKSFAPSLVLKLRIFETRKWLVAVPPSSSPSRLCLACLHVTNIPAHATILRER